MTSMSYAAGPGAERNMRGRAAEELAAYRAGGGLLGLFERTGFRPVSDVLAEYGILGQRTLAARAEAEAAAAETGAAVPQAALYGADLAVQAANVVGPAAAEQSGGAEPVAAEQVFAEAPALPDTQAVNGE